MIQEETSVHINTLTLRMENNKNTGVLKFLTFKTLRRSQDPISVDCQINASHMSLDVRLLKACWYVGGCNTISVSLEYVVSADNSV